MGMIRKINPMGVPLQVEDLLFNIDRKNKEREDASHAGRRVTSGTIVQIWLNPQSGGAKARHSQVSRLGMTLQAKMILQGHSLLSSSRSSWSSHKCLMARGKTSILSSSDDSDDECDDEGKPSVDELVHAVKFFRMFALNKRLNLKF
jgi:hypothetical protein